MKPQQIGPLPLIDGLQLQPAQGKTSGLYRAMNVESRDGLLQTRRGTQFTQAVLLSSQLPGAQLSPASWLGQTVTYLGLVNGSVQADQIVVVGAAGLIANGDESLADGEALTIEFWGDDFAWHTLDAFSISDVLAGKWIQQGNFRLAFIVPHGWRNDQPAGTPGIALWIRFTRTNAWTAAATFGISVGANAPISALGPQSIVAAPTTRKGAGPFVATPYYSGAAGTVPRWAVIDIGKQPTQTGVSSFGANDDFVARAALVAGFDGTPGAYVYVAASDKLLLSLSGNYFELDCGKAAGEANALVPFVPIIDLDGQYGDRDCEAALPPSPAAMAVFGGRVFIGGFPSAPQMIRWSAPLAFWETWPSSNVTFLGGGASGQILAMVPLNETLFIFTTSGIWRAQLGDPTAGNESNLFVDLVEETPCASARSVVACGSTICFLAPDGVRRFDGQRSRLLTDGVRDLFRPDSAQQLACFRPATATGVWHPMENQYRLAFASPAAPHNDVVLVVDLDDRTTWLWGADQVAGQDELDHGFVDANLVIQRARGMRVAGWAWDARQQLIVFVDPEGLLGRCDVGGKDFTTATAWYFETQNLRIARNERAVVTEVDLSIVREHFQPFSVSVIPDGNRAAADTRSCAVDSDGLDTTAVIGAASLAGNMTPLQLDASIAPIHARFRKLGRNHRVRVESIAPNHDTIKLLAMNAEIVVQDTDR